MGIIKESRPRECTIPPISLGFGLVLKNTVSWGKEERAGMSTLSPRRTLGNLKLHRHQSHQEEKASLFLFFLPLSGLPLPCLRHIPPSLLRPHLCPRCHCSPTGHPFSECLAVWHCPTPLFWSVWPLPTPYSSSLMAIMKNYTILYPFYKVHHKVSF